MVEIAKKSRKKQKRRSPWERIVVWGVILVLLAVVSVEWTSRRNFEATLASLEGVAKAKAAEGKPPTMTSAEARSRIKGFAFHGEGTKNQQRQLTFQWPSLFRLYKIGILFDASDNITFLETITPEEPTRSTPKPSAPPFVDHRPLPKRGFSQEASQFVALNLKDQGRISPNEEAGSLTREIFRQSVLIAARDELGLSTFDSALGEFPPESETAVAFPFDLEVRIVSRDNAKSLLMMDVELSRPVRGGKWFSWASPPIKLPLVNSVEGMVASAEQMSRAEFVEALKSAGLKKNEQAARSSSNGPLPDDVPLDFVSQYASLRNLHARLRANGESAETLGALVRAYANLGSLIDFHWGPASKAMHARALLYAQRLLVREGTTPWTLSHRAYARGLAGRHMTALEDIRDVRTAPGTAAPKWFDLIDAYCSYQPAVFDKEHGVDHELAAYLRMRLADPINNEMKALQAIHRFAERNPACCRTAVLLCEIRALGVRRMTTEVGFYVIWPHIYSRLFSIHDLPESLKSVAAKQRGVVVNENVLPDPQLEYRTRLEFIDQLQKTDASARDRSEPSWTVLAELLRDTTFLQTWRRLDVEANALAISCDATLIEVAPLVQNHRYADFLFSFTSQKGERTALLNRLVESLDLSRLELPAYPMVVRLQKNLNKHASDELYRVILSHANRTFDDLNRQRKIPSNDGDFFATILRLVSPYQPASVTWAIEQTWEEAEPHAREWEEAYRDSPIVILALAKKYRQLEQFDDEERCLEISAETNPTHASYRQYADFLIRNGDLAGGQELLESALNLPSLGLENATVRVQLADILMRQGDWETAQIHANEAANSYAGWALKAASRCAEGRKDWKLAEACMRALSERYDSSRDDWYFWCYRTGQGNIKAARSFAKQMWDTWSAPLMSTQRWSRGASFIVIGNTDRANEIFWDSIDQEKDLYLVMEAAVMADAAGNHSLRDTLFEKVAEKWDQSRTLAELVDVFRRSLAVQEGFRWDRDSFESLAINASSQDVTYLYQLSGTLLGNHGQTDLANEYLQTAATGFNVNSFACLFATQKLREQNQEIGPIRSQELPDELEPLVKLLKKGRTAMKRGEYDAALGDLNEALTLRPGFLPALLAKGRVNTVRGTYSEAISEYRNVLSLNPDCQAAHRALAWLFAACEQDDIRNGPEALKHATKVWDLRNVKTALTYATLAAAHAECGDFENAQKMESKSNRASPNHKETRDRLGLYRKNQPFRGSGKSIPGASF